MNGKPVETLVTTRHGALVYNDLLCFEYITWLKQAYILTKYKRARTKKKQNNFSLHA